MDRIDLSKKYVVMVSGVNVERQFVSLDGADDCWTPSKKTALNHAAEMKEAFPDMIYEVFELVEVKE